MTMRGISRFFANALNDNAQFKIDTLALTTEEFNYYVNVDLSREENVPLPYFSIVTYNDEDEKETKKAFKSIFLIGIQRENTVTVNKITEEPTLANLETLVRKAIDVVLADMRIFGIEGEKNIKVSYLNMYVPNPDGEEDLQMQVDIELEQEKYLSC